MIPRRYVSPPPDPNPRPLSGHAAATRAIKPFCVDGTARTPQFPFHTKVRPFLSTSQRLAAARADIMIISSSATSLTFLFARLADLSAIPSRRHVIGQMMCSRRLGARKIASLAGQIMLAQ